MVNPVQLQKFLKGVDYPARKETLLENARKMGADENVCASLEQLPDEDYQTPAEVSQAVGKLADEDRRPSSGSRRRSARRSEAEPGEHSGYAEFLAQALADSMAEIEMCELALERSASDPIKVFAQQMMDEHSRMGQLLEQLAVERKLVLPKDVKKEQKSVLGELAKLSGIDFERRFVELSVREHERAVKVFKHYAEEDDDDIADLAEDAARTFSNHLKMAKELSKKLQA